ncbi:hypothetical protein [Paenibacillus thermotolerans]|nr:MULTISPECIES: hypothetical protein [unclassified Paenibacillus]
MKKINLRDLYSFFKTDVWVDVDEEVAHEIRRFEGIAILTTSKGN